MTRMKKRTQMACQCNHRKIQSRRPQRLEMRPPHQRRQTSEARLSVEAEGRMKEAAVAAATPRLDAAVAALAVQFSPDAVATISFEAAAPADIVLAAAAS